MHGHAWPPVRWQADRRWPGVPVREPQTGSAPGGAGGGNRTSSPSPARAGLVVPAGGGRRGCHVAPATGRAGSCERWQRSARGGVARLVSPAAPAAAPSQGRGAKGVTGSVVSAASKQFSPHGAGPTCYTAAGHLHFAANCPGLTGGSGDGSAVGRPARRASGSRK